MVAAAAMAASSALPPARRAATPDAEASAWGDATMPRGAHASSQRLWVMREILQTKEGLRDETLSPTREGRMRGGSVCGYEGRSLQPPMLETWRLACSRCSDRCAGPRSRIGAFTEMVRGGVFDWGPPAPRRLHKSRARDSFPTISLTLRANMPYVHAADQSLNPRGELHMARARVPGQISPPLRDPYLEGDGAMIRHWLAPMLGTGVLILTLAITGCGATRSSPDSPHAT